MWCDNPNSNTCEEVSRHWCTLKMHFLAPTRNVSKLEDSRYSDTLFYWTIPHQWTWEIICPYLMSLNVKHRPHGPRISIQLHHWILDFSFLKLLWKLWIGGPWGVIIKRPTFHDKPWFIIIGGKILDYLLFVLHLISQSSDAIY